MSLILNGDTGISAVDGTASAPALVGNDTDTGVYFSAANTLDFATAGTRRASINSTGDLQFNSGYGSVATAYGCRAWVNFDGTGTVAIRASGNVTSITDSGTGSYVVNFTTAMPDVNYSVVGAVGPASAGGECVQITSLATTGATIATSNNLTGLVDRANVGVAILR
jgi:hypothetical protein